jgi:hypothetical protein
VADCKATACSVASIPMANEKATPSIDNALEDLTAFKGRISKLDSSLPQIVESPQHQQVW